MLKYFATLEGDELLEELNGRIHSYNLHLEREGLLQLWRKSYRQYYNENSLGSVRRSGDEGEFAEISVNHYRNLLLHLKNLICNQKPSFETQAANSDLSSEKQCILAKHLLEYFQRETSLDVYIPQVVELALVFGVGYLFTEWDLDSGELLGVSDDDMEIRQGEFDITVANPFDVIVDHERKDRDNQWVILRKKENKFDLAAKFKVEVEDLGAEEYSPYTLQADTRFNRSESDLCDYYTLYHSPSPSVPDGRVLIFTKEVILFDGPLPYSKLPVASIVPDIYHDNNLGYSIGFDLLPLQEASDRLTSCILTNQETHAVSNILVPRGAGTTVEEISNGLNFIEYEPKMGAPTSLNLTNTPSEVFEFVKLLESWQQTISGVNSVARGNPEASLKSGAALALVQSMALQFATQLQNSYFLFLTHVGQQMLDILKNYVEVPRIVTIAGKNNRFLTQEFKSDDISQVNRVFVEPGNPINNSIAGKVNLAETLIQNGLITSPEQYLEVLESGRIEPLIEGERSELLLIRQENERLMEVQESTVMITDKHKLHIQEHKAIMANPEIRDNPQIVQLVTDHIMYHINMLKTADPMILGLLGEKSVAQPQVPQQQQGVPAQQAQLQNPINEAAANVNLPNMPKNPLDNM